jgi:RNA polymerase sigma-70 factor (ECF subfamily)
MSKASTLPHSVRTEALADAELAARAAAGDAAAFEAIMRRHNRRLFRTARAILKDDGEVEDVLQEAYLRAFRALDKFRAESRLSTWLVRITANEALGRLRRKGAEVIPLEAAMATGDTEAMAFLVEASERGPEQSAAGSQLRRIVEEQIDRLPDAFRLVFVLRAVEELSVEEVAQALDIPEATVRTRFFRARSLLRESLAQRTDAALSDAFSFDGEHCDRIVERVLARMAAEPAP